MVTSYQEQKRAAWETIRRSDRSLLRVVHDRISELGEVSQPSLYEWYRGVPGVKASSPRPQGVILAVAAMVDFGDADVRRTGPNGAHVIRHRSPCRATM